jgi:hypothetical protein
MKNSLSANKSLGRFLSALLILMSCSLAAQREGDSFAVGFCDYMFPHGCVEPYGSAIYKFNEEGLEAIIEPAGLNLNTDYSRAAFSDKHTGDLLFASNGWRLVNRAGQTLSPKLWFNHYQAPHSQNGEANLLYTQNPRSAECSVVVKRNLQFRLELR